MTLKATPLQTEAELLESKTPNHKANSQELIDLAFYLEGMYKGQGNLLPLGTIHLENLWAVIKVMQEKERC